jgi:hypothetical protein
MSRFTRVWWPGPGVPGDEWTRTRLPRRRVWLVRRGTERPGSARTRAKSCWRRLTSLRDSGRASSSQARMRCGPMNRHSGNSPNRPPGPGLPRWVSSSATGSGRVSLSPPRPNSNPTVADSGNCCAAPCAGHDCPGRKRALDTRASRDCEEDRSRSRRIGRTGPCWAMSACNSSHTRIRQGERRRCQRQLVVWGLAQGLARHGERAPGWSCLGDPVLCRPSCERRPEQWRTDQAPLPIRTVGLIRTWGTPPSSPCQRINPAIHRECGRNGRLGGPGCRNCGSQPGTVEDRCRPGPGREQGRAGRIVASRGVASYWVEPRLARFPASCRGVHCVTPGIIATWGETGQHSGRDPILRSSAIGYGWQVGTRPGWAVGQCCRVGSSYGPAPGWPIWTGLDDVSVRGPWRGGGCGMFHVKQSPGWEWRGRGPGQSGSVVGDRGAGQGLVHGAERLARGLDRLWNQ